MTRTEKRFIARAIKMAAKKADGAPANIIEQVFGEEIERAIEFAKEEDRGELGVEVTEDPPELAGKLPQPPALMPDSEPRSFPRETIHAVDTPVPAKRLIILPDEEGFNSAVKNKPQVGVSETLHLWKDPDPEQKLSSEEYQARWQAAIVKLVNLVTQNMPPFLQVVPAGASGQLTIDRLNVLSDVPVGIVKALYGLKGQSGSVRSEPGAITPMNIDRVVTSMFNIRDTAVNWEQRIMDVRTQSEDAFRPRPRELVNHTPAPRADLLSLSNAAAYAEESNDERRNAILVDSARSAPRIPATDPEYEEWKRQRNRSGPRVPSLLE